MKTGELIMIGSLRKRNRRVKKWMRDSRVKRKRKLILQERLKIIGCLIRKEQKGEETDVEFDEVRIRDNKELKTMKIKIAIDTILESPYSITNNEWLSD